MPIDPASFAAYVIAVSAVILTPGPDTLIILRHAMASGRGVGLAAVAGVQVGLVGHTLLAVLGISMLIASTPPLFKAVAVAGAAYLGWLGIQGLRASGSLVLDRGGAAVGGWTAARQAVLTNLLNPKVILLFLALFPQFVDAGRGDVTVQLLFLSAVLIGLNVAWQAPLAFVGAAMARWIERPAVQSGVARATGAVFLAFAGLMLWDHLM